MLHPIRPYGRPLMCGNRLSIYVLESSNSRRLTYFMPPLVRIPFRVILHD